MRKKILEWLLGAPRSPIDQQTRKHIALIAFLAWIGLGADSLSSACYGPEQSYIALGSHIYFAPYLALVTALTIFLIALAYNQVIKLFPNGGGGYKVATELLGNYAGLVSGSALIVDYMMTIAISIASGADALFSLLPLSLHAYKLVFEVIILCYLLLFNLRGAKESIKLLIPIFLGFFITHLFLILIGIILHANKLHYVAHMTIVDAHRAILVLGLPTVLALFLRAYSLGAGTYTGIEAVSNNVHILAEPRVTTGRWTMFYMAISLSLIAGGIILLYMLWNVHPEIGQTLNAIVFRNVLSNFPYPNISLTVVLFFEAGLLFVAANTGFLGGPAVLANMAMDAWVPRRFSMLSSRLVTQNGIIFFGVTALIILLGTDGDVYFLVVLYSINVFLTFSMSLLGLTFYWWKNHDGNENWLAHFIFSGIAFLICTAILGIILFEKFAVGGWITVLITGLVVAFCLLIRRHYKKIDRLKKQLEHELEIKLIKKKSSPSQLDTQQPTAVFLVKDLGAAMHSLLWVIRMFPDDFQNFIFIRQGLVDIGSFGSERKLRKLQKDTRRILSYLVRFIEYYGFYGESHAIYGIDPVADIEKVAEQIVKTFPNVIFFASRYILPTDSWMNRILHSDLAPIIQKRLHLLGAKMLILPLNLQVT